MGLGAYFFNILLALGPTVPQVKVAVIDSGISESLAKKVPICRNGLIDLTEKGMASSSDHGVNVTSLLTKQVKISNYCLYIIKFWHPDLSARELSINTIKAFKLAMELDVELINYSAGGAGASRVERLLISRLLNKGTILVTAAGNNGKNLDLICGYYPACYSFEDKNFIVVGSLTKKGTKAISSNYGSVVDIFEVGDRQSAEGITMSGTSQATAVVSGKIINTLNFTRAPNSEASSAIKTTAHAIYLSTELDKTVQLGLQYTIERSPEDVRILIKGLSPVVKALLDGSLTIKVDF